MPLICSLAPTRIVYKRNYLVRGDELNLEGDAIDFDVVTELVFPDRLHFALGRRSQGASAASRSSRTS
jgi:hypothetical protein